MVSDQASYTAGVIDAIGRISVRETPTADLPQLAVSGSNVALLRYLGEITGVRPIVTRRSYVKAGCSEHCREKHLHVMSHSGRWLVSGAKATIVLAACLPHMHVKQIQAAEAVRMGLGAPFKSATPKKMEALGWPIPRKWRTAAKTPGFP